MQLETINHQLTALESAGKTFECVAAAHRALACAPALAGPAETAIRLLVAAGLGGPVRELAELQRIPRSVLDHLPAEFPNGRVAWTRFRSTFEVNLRVMAETHPHLVPLVRQQAGRLAEWHLYGTVRGEWWVASRLPGQVRQWHFALTESLNPGVQLPPKGAIGPVAVIHPKSGELLETLLERTSRLFLSYSHPLFLIDGDPARFAAWLHVADVGELLREARVQLFLGEHAIGQLESALRQEKTMPLPTVVVNQSTAADMTERVTQVAERVAAARSDELASLRAKLADRYRDRDAPCWSKRFRPPGLVLGVTSRFTTMLQYSMRDAMEALERAGWRTEVLIESADHHQHSQIRLYQRILELDPVLLVFLDHARAEDPGLPRSLPHLCWIQDPMPNLLCPQAGASMGPLDFVCGYYKDRCTKEFGYPAEQFIPTVIPVSSSRFHDGPIPDEARRAYECDVSFVSNASAPMERIYQSTAQDQPAGVQPLLRRIYELVTAALGEGTYLSHHEGVPKLVRQAAGEFGAELDPRQVDQLSSNFAYRLYDWGRRQQSLEWVADWARRTGRRFRIYGRGWESHPTLSAFARGPIEHGEPLRCANRASKLALQLIPTGFRHQRSYELIRCGTLPLTRYCATDFNDMPVAEYVRRRDAGEPMDTASLLFPRLERVTFNTADEFATLAERFLADEEYRRGVHAEYLDVVNREHTYDAVMRRVMEFIADGLKRKANT